MKRWALVIGISQYQNRDFFGSPMAVKNAQALDQCLQRAGYTTVCLHDELGTSDSQKPTRLNIEMNLRNLCDTATDEDIIFVYFAGYGIRQAETLMLFAQDAQSSDDGMWLEPLQESFKKSQTARSLLILEIMQTDFNFPVLSQVPGDWAGGLLFTSTNLNYEQQLRTQSKVTNTIFVDSLLEGLSGKADQDKTGKVTIQDLGQYVINVVRQVQADADEIVQSPNFIPNTELATATALIDFNSLSLQRKQHRAQCFTEPVINLDLMLIPGGTFMMGSPPDELDRYDDEGPQHSVTVSTFLMGRYPITQAQWRAIAMREDLQVSQELNPDPSNFKGENHPVERVSWYEAVEFCERLSRLSGHSYRLPTEAEWEYACRAGTTTPFHFGETITTDLANYRGTDDEELDWSGSYGKGLKGIFREETTPVDEFLFANAFGLHDMHGNVWEWCVDHWHDNYDGAPTDGSAWLTDEEDARRVRRGGSWFYNPRYCRSAYRGYCNPVGRNYDFGFRVVCEARGL